MSIETATPKLGHPIGFWFFFWGEFAERCSYYGMRAILAKYMANQLGLGQDNAATYMSFFIAACYLLPLLGGWVADRFLGKYWTIVGFSVPYILGHFILGFENFYCLVSAMCLLAMGSGVIKPNISTLMGLTYDQERPGQELLRSDAFAIFYFAINIGAAISQFAMPPIRTEYGYAVAFMFPALLMVISFAIFAAGKRFYAREKITIHRETTPAERQEQWRILGRVFGLFALVMFFWAIFDQASSTWIFFTDSCMDRHIFGKEMEADQMQAVNPVLILILLPPITLLWKLLDKKGIRVRATDKMVAGFILTTVCMGVMALAAWLAGAAELRVNVAEPQKDKSLNLIVEGSTPLKLTGTIKADANTPGQLNISYATSDKTEGTISVVSNGDLKLVNRTETKIVVEGEFEKLKMKTKVGSAEKTTEVHGIQQIALEGEMQTTKTWFVARQNLVTVWWLVLAYLVITVAEVLVSVTGLELAYTAAPKHMTGFVTAGWLFTVFVANLLINAPVTRLYTVLQPTAYFGMLTLAMFIVTGVFIFVAGRFNRSAPRNDAAVSEAVTEAV